MENIEKETLKKSLKFLCEEIHKFKGFEKFKIDIGLEPETKVQLPVGILEMFSNSCGNKLLFKILLFPGPKKIKFLVYWVENKDLTLILNKLVNNLNELLKENIEVVTNNEYDMIHENRIQVAL